jgi:putative transposase
MLRIRLATLLVIFRAVLSSFRSRREVIAAMDLFVVLSVSFRPSYVWFAIEHARRRILHINVTEHRTASWVVQQLREALPFDSAARYLVFDRDSILSADVLRAAKAMGMKPIRIAFASPWQNWVAKRWILSARREMLDQTLILNACHLLRLIRQYVSYHHADRTHLGLGKRIPARRAVQQRPGPGARGVGLRRVGGMQPRYERRQAA